MTAAGLVINFHSASLLKAGNAVDVRLVRLSKLEHSQMLAHSRLVLRVMRVTTPIIISCGLVSAITFALWMVKVETSEPTHLIFIYLLPITIVTFAFGSFVGLISGALASLLGFYFLYDPIYTFYFNDLREIGEVAWFLVLVLLGTKCVVEIRRP